MNWPDDYIGKIINGDCKDILKELPNNFVDSIVTDPPAGIGFMGKEWDDDKGGRDNWIKWLSAVMSEARRVLKPGGHALVWSLPRTSHWTGTALENAGFEVRDCVYHLFGSGFPKSLNIGKAIDKQNGKFKIDLSDFGNYIKEMREKKGYSKSKLDKILGTKTAVSWWEGRLGGVNLPSKKIYQELKKVLNLDERFDYLINWTEAEREKIGEYETDMGGLGGERLGEKGGDITIPKTPEAKQWEGWGTALKPAVECWWLVRKPLSENTVAENVLKHGTGGLNIDGTRIGVEGGGANGSGGSKDRTQWRMSAQLKFEGNIGRFPSHLIHDGSDVILAEFAKAGESKSVYHEGDGKPLDKDGNWGFKRMAGGFEDEGSPARFFYTAKPSSSEKNLLYGEFEERQTMGGGGLGLSSPELAQAASAYGSVKAPAKNFHPTVKAQSLMCYLIKLITPPKGIVLDMFAGSGSTLLAAKSMGHPFIGIEIDPEYVKICEGRLKQTVLNF